MKVKGEKIRDLLNEVLPYLKTIYGKEGQWHSINYIPFHLFHQKWKYFLFEMMKKEFGEEIRLLIDKLYRKYPRGIVVLTQTLGDVDNQLNNVLKLPNEVRH